MRYGMVLVLALAMALTQMACKLPGMKKKGGALDLSSETNRFSYALGLEIGTSLKQISENTELNLDLVERGIRDQVGGVKAQLSDSASMTVKRKVFMEMQGKQQKKAGEKGKKNLAEEEAFLAKNKTKSGVITTPSGLQYEVLAKGTGKSPSPTDQVSVHYKGTLLDGTEFDNSYSRGEPANFQVGGVIPGWAEALQLMSAGGKYKLYVPSKLAYGEQGAGGKIEPNSLLIFEVELLKIGAPEVKLPRP